MADYGTGPGFGTASPYDVLRNRASQRATSGGQTASEAMARRYAAMGDLNSGSAIRSEQLQDQSNQQQKEDAIGKIDLGEAQQGAQQNFQSAEASKGRDFEGAQNKIKMDQQANQFGAQMSLEQTKEQHAQSNADRQYNLDVQTTAFNKDLADFQKGHTGGFFGGGGFLGLGF